MLRPATEADKELVRVWRNHPEVQAVSLQQETITPQMHDRWWSAVQQDDSRLVLVYERRGEPAGVVNFFDLDPASSAPRTAMWGYYLDNAGLGGALLPAWMQIQREGVRYAFDELRLDALEGEVLDRNEAVRSMNTRNGFIEVDSYEREVGGAPTLVHRIRRTRPDAPTHPAPTDPKA